MAVAVGMVCLVVLLLTGGIVLRGEGFSPDEKISAPGIESVTVSAEDTAYPTADVSRFDGRPEAAYVYVAVEGLPSAELQARVERSARVPVLAWLFPNRSRLVVRDEGQEQLSSTPGGVSGVVKFAVRTASGRPLPSGNYTVRVFVGSANGRSPAAEKSFVVGG